MAVEHTLIHEQLAPALEQLKTGDTLQMPSSTPEKPSSSEEAKEQPAKSGAQDAQDEQEEATTSEDPTKDTSPLDMPPQSGLMQQPAWTPYSKNATIYVRK
jgi:hypothetical protein